MTARETPSKGAKPDKLMRDAVMVALNRAANDADGKPTRKLHLIAAKLVELAVGGDMTAIKEVIDRVDGKVPQESSVTIDSKRDAIDWTTAELLAVIDKARDCGGGSGEAPRSTIEPDQLH